MKIILFILFFTVEVHARPLCIIKFCRPDGLYCIKRPVRQSGRLNIPAGLYVTGSPECRK